MTFLPESVASHRVDEPHGADGAVVHAENIAKRLGDTQALRDASLSARGGEIHAIVGENGSGKSTLGKIIGGVHEPDSGTISVLGAEPTSPLQARRLGVELVLQEIVLVERASVVDNLYLGRDGLFRSFLPAKLKISRASEIMQRLTKQELDVRSPVGDLPVGLQQWVVIARALLGDPRVLVLDEASAALDRSGAERLYETARNLANAGCCVITVTHRIEEIVGIVDKATILRDGVSVGTLSGTDITEPTLLSLMSAGEAPDERAARRAPASSRKETRVDVRGMRLAPRSESTIDLEVRAGEIVGLAALEGHGARELIEAITGVRPPAQGEIIISGRHGPRRVLSRRAATRAGVAYVSGDRKIEGTFPNLSVLENFGMGLYRTVRRWGLVDNRAVRRIFLKEATSLGIRYGATSDSIESLSGGSQQKVLIARALTQRPLVLVLNDPNRGVDIPTKRDVVRLLHEIAADGVAILLFSTEISELCGTCDRVVVLRGGGSFRELKGSDLTGSAVLASMFGQAISSDNRPGGK